MTAMDCPSGAAKCEAIAGFPMSMSAKVVVLVAHPDDETLWAGGTLLMQGGWQVWVSTLCRGGDGDRAPRFKELLKRIGANGTMGDLDDGPGQLALAAEQVRDTLLALLPKGRSDLVMTHAPQGEYTRHLRHEEVSRSVLRMWACGEIQSQELWLFAYQDESGHRLPMADDDAEVVVDLSDEIWMRKRELLTGIYGFVPGSWEVRATPRREAFWRLLTPKDAWAWLERGRGST